MLPIRILSTATAHPPKINTAQLEQQLCIPFDALQATGGVLRRHWASNERQSTLAAQAIQRALDQAGCSLHEVDAIVAANGVPEQAIPCTAALVGRELGLNGMEGIACFDINATCLSFLVAFDNICAQIAIKRYRTVVIFSADLASRGVNFEHLESAAIFGDGVVAVVMQYDDSAQSGLIASSLTTYPQGWQSTQIRAGGTQVNPRTCPNLDAQDFLFQMDGRAIFRLASQVMPQALSQFLDRNQLQLADFDWFVPHQASHLGMLHMRKLLNIRAERIVDIYRDYGNQVAASIPTALHVGIEDKRIQRGQKILLLGTGAGLSIGFLALQF